MNKDSAPETNSPAFRDGFSLGEELSSLPLDNAFVQVARLAGANVLADGIQAGQMEAMITDEDSTYQGENDV